MAGHILVEALRGGVPESVHRVAWCTTAGAGADPDVATFLRSAAKPFQAAVAVESGALERFGLGDRHLAIGCASHGGSPEHIATVAEVLDACGLDENALACGPDQPRDPAQARLPEPSRIAHNCSGKHALALAACVANGWPTDGYLDDAHPLRSAFDAAVRNHCGPYVGEAVDGCGMHTHRASLHTLAAAFGRLARDGGAIAGAMSTHPHLVAYEGAIDTELMRAIPGAVAKVGAEGVLALGLPDGRGAALKVLDGAMRAIDPAAVVLARWLGARVDLPGHERPQIRNSRGDVAGELAALATR